MTTQTQAVLAVLLAEPTAGKYGLEISKAVGYPSGTIYPVLARLETAGWVESEWENIDPQREGRRPRRYYWLTGAGERAARDALEETARRLSPIFGSIRGEAAPG